MPLDSWALSIKDLLGTIALIAMLSIAFGSVTRRCRRLWVARAVLGLLFGTASVLAMFDPLTVIPGVIADLRTLPVLLAGAFLGPQGVLVAASLAIAARLGIGGSGAPAGVLSLALAGAAGLAWGCRTGGSERRGPAAIGALAALSWLCWAAIPLAPRETLRTLAFEVVPLLGALQTLGVLLVAPLLERERRLLGAERRLVLDADRDGLTGLLNRRGFERAMAALPQDVPGALLLLDLDHFKRINDAHGHAGGDAVLRGIAGRLTRTVGPGSLLARLGGEEFAVFLPDRPRAAARATAQGLGRTVRAVRFALPDGSQVAVTVSLGGASGHPATLERLMLRADAALYAAKDAGRDRTVFAGDAPAPDRAEAPEDGAPGRTAPCAACGSGETTGGPAEPDLASGMPEPAMRAAGGPL